MNPISSAAFMDRWAATAAPLPWRCRPTSTGSLAAARDRYHWPVWMSVTRENPAKAALPEECAPANWSRNAAALKASWSRVMARLPSRPLASRCRKLVLSVMPPFRSRARPAQDSQRTPPACAREPDASVGQSANAPGRRAVLLPATPRRPGTLRTGDAPPPARRRPRPAHHRAHVGTGGQAGHRGHQRPLQGGPVAGVAAGVALSRAQAGVHVLAAPALRRAGEAGADDAHAFLLPRGPGEPVRPAQRPAA